MTKQKEQFIKSSLTLTPEEKAKEKKHRETQIRADKKKAGEKVVKKADKVNDSGREDNGDFAKNNTFGVGNGRPPIFSDPDELAKKIDQYIDNCPDTKTCYNSEGIGHEEKIPSISGLGYFLGFESRQSMYDYKNKDNGFSYIIKRAMFYMEKHYEQIMQGKAPTGAIFALKNMGWRDKTEVDNTIKVEDNTIKVTIE